jgi:O-antigen ligase
MPEHIRALIVILPLAAIVFALARVPACTTAVSAADYLRRRNLWFGLTLIAFFAHDFWLYIGLAGVLLVAASRVESNRIALFAWLVLALPNLGAEIPGLGLINHFFTINYVRMLALTVLLGAALRLATDRDTVPFGRLLPDKLLLAFLVLSFVLILPATTFTNVLRSAVFNPFVDVVLPYYVASRSLKRIEDFRDALMAFVVGAAVMAAIAVFEFFKHWLMYAGLEQALGISWGTDYLRRGGSLLRAEASTGHPIVLGYVMAVAIGLQLALRPPAGATRSWNLLTAILAAGLIASLSRGPWIGAAAIVLVFLVTGPRAAEGIMKLSLLGIGFLLAAFAAGFGGRVVDLLPFVGSVEEGNISYRVRLLEAAVQQILENPFFGSFDFYQALEAQGLKQGQGIVDIVNSYLGIGLASGLVGLGLFAGFFVTAAAGIARGVRRGRGKDDEMSRLGRGLLATVIGIMLIIFTVSSISVIPVIYWMISGVAVAYGLLAARAAAAAAQPSSLRPAGVGSGA